jgi:hypothetical protein
MKNKTEWNLNKEEVFLLALYLTSRENKFSHLNYKGRSTDKMYTQNVLGILQKKGFISNSRYSTAIHLTKERILKAEEIKTKYVGKD